MNNIIEAIKEVPDNFKSFFLENNRNPILWIALFFIGIFVFFVTYNALNKNK